ncbi:MULTISPECIES: hypothetical protein [Sphingobium]|uniref:Uncharacterized protein n=1 Tax=Sphingobium cupriresistens TaxID=1132417 RepID=A0A8G1ZGW1_9SPHN|nr:MULTISPECIES: hypothetical protein [Sphingobium]RYM11727.1 hypothetical protein EWH12_08570 [Sphingobium cupriresistens]WCP11879.1 hypothetical protein sphantq_00274 [Sphingobium sp. AntQ-1]
MKSGGFYERNAIVLMEAHNALNLAFGAILSAYVGNSLANIDHHSYNHATLARFFILIAISILGLCVGNTVMLRGDFTMGAMFALVALIAGLYAFRAGGELGFEVVVLRVLSECWIGALLMSNTVLTIINYINHRNRSRRKK